MKYILIILLSISTLLTQAQSPCEDKIYQEYKAKPIDSLTARQYEYMINQEKLCSEFNKEQTKQKANKSMVNTYVAVIVLVTVLGIFVPLIVLQP